jgi:two-component system, sporulation sensor kinase D
LESLIDKIALSFTEKEMQSFSFEIQKKVELISDRNIIEQVILNLIKNAFQSFSNSEANKQVAITIKPIKKDNIIISIRDNGDGITQENFKNIFNPFFTTKEKGTGLGLPVSKRLIELLGGSITITSNVGEGTEVAIHLPLNYKEL